MPVNELTAAMRDNSLPADDVTLTVHPALEPFVRLLLARDDWQAQLAPLFVPEEFVAAACQLAAQAGIGVDPGLLKDQLRPDPAGLSRWMPAPVTMPRWPDDGWIPARPISASGAPLFDWARVGAARLAEPFFEQGIRRHASLPLNLLLRTRTDLDTLVKGAETADHLPLRGLIFHMSRCGSTLVSRMLNAVERFSVVSEAEPLDAVVQWAQQPGVGEEEGIAAVRAMAAALGRRRDPRSEAFFIKLDAWHTLSLPLFRRAFPDVPWLYLYRDPVEVMVSHLAQPGMHTIPGALPPSVISIPGAELMPREEFVARVLHKIGASVLDHWNLGGGLAIDYADLLGAGREAIAAHFELDLDAEERAAMELATMADAKQPDQQFAADAERKRSGASEAVRETARQHLETIHRELGELGRHF